MSGEPRIAVVGAGPGGLICARVLQRHGIPVAVLERDASRQARPQGGTLDMHPEDGQVALRAAGLLDDFLARSRPEGEQGRLLDADGTVLLESPPPEGEGPGRPEIDRTALRDLLLDSLEPGTVRWGRAVTEVEPVREGVHRLRFGDGGEAEFDLVVGADGAWSRVRPLLSEAVPAYSGVSFVEARLEDVEHRHPAAAALVGEGSMFALRRNRGLIAQRNGDGTVRVYAAMRVEEGWHRRSGADLEDTAGLRGALLVEFEGWAPSLLALITENDGAFVNRPLHALPVPHRWAHRPGLTLLGDAAHLMSPFSGKGANLAMLDGAELALAIAAGEDLDAAVRAYEEVMLPRSIAAAEGAAAGLDAAIAADAPAHTIERMRAVQSSETSAKSGRSREENPASSR